MWDSYKRFPIKLKCLVAHYCCMWFNWQGATWRTSTSGHVCDNSRCWPWTTNSDSEHCVVSVGTWLSSSKASLLCFWWWVFPSHLLCSSGSLQICKTLGTFLQEVQRASQSSIQILLWWEHDHHPKLNTRIHTTMVTYEGI